MAILEFTRKYHRLIDDLLILHQEALIEQRMPLALDIWQLFASLLKQHIAVENQFVLPLAGPLIDSLRWPASLYQHEHNKIEDLMTKTEARLVALESVPMPARRRLLIELMDYQRSFKNVIEHHEEREEIALLPELESLLTKQQLGKLQADLRQGWTPLADLEQARERFNALLNSTTVEAGNR